MTRSAIHDTLYRKSHRACRGNAPPSCLRKTALPLKSPTGAFIATQTRTFRKVQNGEDLFPMKIFTALQYTRFILPPIHPTKSSLRCVGGIFLFWELLGARPLHLLSQTALPLKSPMGAFIAAQTLIFRRKQIIRTHLLSETSSDHLCLVRVARIELTAS